LTALVSFFSSMTGWQRGVMSVVLGIVTALALPPLYLAPAMIVGYTALAAVFTGLARKRSAFVVGWCFGFGYFAISLYWVGFALLVEADKYAWLLPFSALGLPALLGIFSGLALVLALAIVRRFGLSGYSRILVLALCWTLFEWLRGFVLTGFPWNLPGYAWGGSAALSQFASVVGVHGLGLLAFVFAASPLALAGAGSRFRRWGPLGISVLALGVIGVWGQARLQQNPTSYVDGVNLRLVQAAVDQKDKWRPEFRRTFLERYREMSSRPGIDDVSLLIWPETAIPYFLDREPEIRQSLGEMLAQNSLLLTGIARTHAGPRLPGTPFEYWNSIQALNAKGEIVATYDKHHLVPFGEYVPFRAVLGLLGIERLAAGRGDFQRGAGPETLPLPGYPGVGPLICYEVIFPGNVVASADRPQWMLNVTNDAWFGVSAGPHQHLAIARMRSIEEGLPLVRAANSGISAIIDSYGRLTGHLDLGVSDILDGQLPGISASPPLYANYGNFILLALFLAFAGLVMVLRKSEDTRSDT